MIRVMFISFWVNLFLTIGKLVIGYIGFSSVLIADGFSSLSDMITDILAIFGGIFSSKRADKTHPFGYGKLEYVFSLFISIFVIFLGIVILLNISLEEFIMPKYFVLIFAITFIVIKLLLVNYLSFKAKILNSDIILASSMESRTDVYSTIIAVVSIVFSMLSVYIDYFKYSSIIATIFIGFLVLRAGILILIYNAKELSVNKFVGNLNQEVKDIILSHKEIEYINKLYLFKYGTYYQLLAEVIFVNDIKLSKAHDIIEEIELELKKKKIKYVYIESDS